MYASLLPALGFMLLATLATATGDISLSSFTPRINNLPTACKTVYTTKIDSCVASDFGTSAVCSSACLSGLAKIGAAVKSGCKGVDVGETSIIGVFQNDLGVAALCPNNRQTSTASSMVTTTTSSTTATSTPTRTALTNTNTATTSSAAASSTPASSGTASTTAATSTVFTATPLLPTTSSAANGNSQLSNSDSGGGSPFDVVATGGAGKVVVRYRGALAVIVVACIWGLQVPSA